MNKTSFGSDDTCQVVQDQIITALLSGSNFTQELGSNPLKAINDDNPANPQDRNLYFAQFGNSDASKPGDWISVFDESIPAAVRLLGLLILAFSCVVFGKCVGFLFRFF